MQKVIVFTDIHIRDIGQTIIGLDPSERFQQGLKSAIATHPDAHRIVITGDLTHAGTVSEYERLFDHLIDCPIPVSLMLGNHDERANFLSVFPRSPTTENGFVQSYADIAGFRLICLDTLDGPPRPIDLHSGYLCADRLNWLNDTLEGAAGRRCIIFTHHPPYDTGFSGMDAIGLRNKDDLTEILVQHSNVCQIVSGHVHRTLFGNINGMSIAMFKSTCHQQPLTLGDGTSSESIDEPGAYGILLLSEQGVIVLSEDFTLPHSAPQNYED